MENVREFIFQQQYGPLGLILSKLEFIEKLKLRRVCKTWKRVLDLDLKPILSLRDHIITCIGDWTRFHEEDCTLSLRNDFCNMLPKYLRLPLPDEVFAFPWAIAVKSNVVNLLRPPEHIQRDIEFKRRYIPLAEIWVEMSLYYTIFMIPQEEYRGKYFISLIKCSRYDTPDERHKSLEEYIDTPISSLKLYSFSECWSILKEVISGKSLDHPCSMGFQDR